MNVAHHLRLIHADSGEVAIGCQIVPVVHGPAAHISCSIVVSGAAEDCRGGGLGSQGEPAQDRSPTEIGVLDGPASPAEDRHIGAVPPSSSPRSPWDRLDPIGAVHGSDDAVAASTWPTDSEA